MEDLITLIIAIVVGLLSLFSGRKRTTPTPQQRPQTTPQDTEYEWVTAEEAHSDWDQPTPQERPSRQENRQQQPQENKELSPMDVIGKILTGDIEDLLQTKKPSVPRVENEYIDPVKSHPAKPLQSHFEADLSKQATTAGLDRDEPVGSSLYPELSDPAALRQAIVVREILDRPISKRNRHRSVA